MKAKDIQVGGVYAAKVSGQLTSVRVDAIRQSSPLGTITNRLGRVKPPISIYDVTNLKTGRRLTFRSAQRLRPSPAKGCEFCRHPFNRDGGEFNCPYCGKRWSGA